MFYDATGYWAPSFIYPGNCLGDYFNTYLGNGTYADPLAGYNVWGWIVAPFTNEPFTPTVDGAHGASCNPYGPNITSVFSTTWPAQCPSPNHILTTFAIVNIAVALSSLIFGNQRVLHILSCKILGKEHTHPKARHIVMQVLQMFIPLGLHLGANALIALLTRATPSYEDGFTFGQLFLFLAARPRMTWIVASWGAPYQLRDGVKVQGFDLDSNQAGNNLMPTDMSEQAPPAYNQSASHFPHKAFFPYARFAKGQLLAEFVLLAIASYSIGGTAHFASQRGFYNIISGGSEVNYQIYGRDHESAAKMMYAGAIWWIICFPVAFLYLLWTIAMVCLRETWGSGWRYIPVSLVLMCSLWLGQWLWLAGFVNLMGPFYCPPNLATQASIWICSSLVGILFGAGLG